MNPNESQKKYMEEKHEQWNTPSDVIENAVIKATGSRIVEQKRILNGETNEVYDIVTELGQEIILRIYHGQKEKFEKEKWIFGECEKAGVPTPKIILVESLEVDGNPIEICVESKIQGVGLDKAIESEDVLRDLGKNLARLHSIRTDGFGALSREGKGNFSSVQELIVDNKYIRRDKILPALSGRDADIETVERGYEIMKQEAASYPQIEPRLLHNDISPQHVLVNGGKISGIIDFESAVGGDPLLELARWDFKYGKKFPLKHILEGYGSLEISPDDFERRLNFWKINRSFTSLRYCIDEKKQEGIDNSIRGIRESSEYFNK